MGDYGLSYWGRKEVDENDMTIQNLIIVRNRQPFPSNTTKDDNVITLQQHTSRPRIPRKAVITRKVHRLCRTVEMRTVPGTRKRSSSSSRIGTS